MNETLGERFKRLQAEYHRSKWAQTNERVGSFTHALLNVCADPTFAEYVLGLERDANLLADDKSRLMDRITELERLRAVDANRLTAANARAEKAEGVLKQIGRMKLFPDDKTNRFTLHAAKQLATNYFGATPPSDAEEL